MLQSFVLITSVRVFLHDGVDIALVPVGTTPTGTGWINILIALTLLWVLWKISFWVFGAIRGGHRRSVIGSAVHGYLAYKTFGLLRGHNRAANSGMSGGVGSGTRAYAAPDPYTTVRAGSSYCRCLGCADSRAGEQQHPDTAAASTAPARSGLPVRAAAGGG